MISHAVELTWIQHLQNALRGPWMDAFFVAWSYVDSVWFMITVVAAVMYLFNRKEGISLLLIFILSGIVNTLLKKAFGLPRPCQIDPSVGILCSHSFGFPSGAAQTAAIIAGICFVKCRQNIYKILAAIFALFFCFSRIYLGVHFFTDVLGGVLIGAGLVVVYVKLFPLIEKRWDVISAAFTALFLILNMPSQAAMMFGIAVGLRLAKNMQLPTSWNRRILTFAVVVIGSSALIYFGMTHHGIRPLATFLAELWLVYLGNYLVNNFRSR